jgi:hypothetical protein
MKIMAIVERHSLPLSVSTHAANHHEVRFVQLCFDFYLIEAKPENLAGDRAYDGDPLDDSLRQVLVWSAGGDRSITVRIAQISPGGNAGSGNFGIAL